MDRRIASLASVAFLIAAFPSSGAPRLWMDTDPQDSCEAGIRGALDKAGFAGPAGAVGDLNAVATRCPDSVSSGLAHLAAGLALVDGARSAAALPQLRLADIQKTALADYAVLGQAQALDALGDPRAAEAYVAAVDARPDRPNVCASLARAAEIFERSSDFPQALRVLDRALESCSDRTPRLLLDKGGVLESQRQSRAAVDLYRRIDTDFPASPQATEAERRLATLGAIPAPTPDERNARDLKRALALFDAANYRESAALFRLLEARRLPAADVDLVRTRLGRSLLALSRPREAHLVLAKVGTDSPSGAEAAFYRGRLAEQASGATDQLEAVAGLFPDSPWGEEALLALANHYQKDARDEEALPYYGRLLQAFPRGRYADRAAWKVGWGSYRQGRFEEAALTFERAARLDPKSNFTPGMLYWAGRARAQIGQVDRARQLLTETVQRYKRAYHGLRAVEALATLPGKSAAPAPSLGPRPEAALEEVPEPYASRVRQLVLIDRLEDAGAEIRQAPQSAFTRSTLAWIETRLGRLRPAINAMKAAHPEYLSEAGDVLPDAVWRILYPMQYLDTLRARAVQEGLDPALVAALVCQESTFDAGAVSTAGAHGLMQVMPHTGRTLARTLGVRYSPRALHDPTTSLTFGTHYLRELMDRFGGKVERVLAAYNAGPERVEAWTASRPSVSAEEFVESIPFTETRLYVMVVLSSREQYHRLYDFTAPAAAADAGTPRP